MFCYIYARVSTLEQFLHGSSIESQVTACLEHVRSTGRPLGTETNCDIPGVFIDGGKSAFTKTLIKRPGGAKLLAALQPGDTVVVTASHRLFRRLADMVNTMEGWVNAGISVKFLDYGSMDISTANGKAMLYIFAVIAQMKSELNSARQKEAYAIRKERKESVGGSMPHVRLKAPPPVNPDIGALQNEVLAERDRDRFRFTGLIRAYVRVSTKQQTIEQQRRCILHGLPPDMRAAEIIWYEDTGVSAYSTSMAKRPAGGQLMQDLQPGDILVTWRPDRIFRSMIDMAKTVEDIHKHGSFLMTVEGGMRTDTPLGRTMVSLLSLLAEVESQEISRSTRQGQQISRLANGGVGSTSIPVFLSVTSSRTRTMAWDGIFTLEEHFSMYMQLYMTHKQYATRTAAARVISNIWLRRKGLPGMTLKSFDVESRRLYLAKVRRMQKEEYSPLRDKLIRKIKALPKSYDIAFPIHLHGVYKGLKLQEEYVRTAKKMNVRLSSQVHVVEVARSCGADNTKAMLARMS